jgi:hypothetical protein
VYNAGSWDNVACDDVNINDDKYSTSKNPPTGLYTDYIYGMLEYLI